MLLSAISKLKDLSVQAQKVIKDEKYFLFHQNSKLKFFGLSKIPLLFLVQPKVKILNAQECQIEIPLNYITKNHLRSMYFGTLAIGADCAAGLFALYLSEKLHPENKYSLIFKDFHAQFHQRAEGDVLFICRDSETITKIFNETETQGMRSTHSVRIEAWVMKAKNGPLKVADFQLGLSMKRLAN